MGISIQNTLISLLIKWINQLFLWKCFIKKPKSQWPTTITYLISLQVSCLGSDGKCRSYTDTVHTSILLWWRRRLKEEVLIWRKLSSWRWAEETKSNHTFDLNLNPLPGCGTYTAIYIPLVKASHMTKLHSQEMRKVSFHTVVRKDNVFTQR